MSDYFEPIKNDRGIKFAVLSDRAYEVESINLKDDRAKRRHLAAITSSANKISMEQSKEPVTDIHIYYEKGERLFVRNFSTKTEGTRKLIMARFDPKFITEGNLMDILEKIANKYKRAPKN